jgi:putative endopeptidase
MAPQIVNAYYNPLQNEIVFPAAIMQPPFFDGEIDDAINYGAMGAVIGHEITHGFDDQGSRFDADGNMANWWTDEDRTRFEERTQKIINQFDKFIPVDSLHINGSLTQGENIGDLGGLLVSYDALQMARTGKNDPMVDGFTQDQRFYLSWAQAWRNLDRDEGLKLQINTDPHSPAKYRVNGPLENLPTFQAAFGCKAGDPMVAPDSLKVAIW